MNGNNGTRHWQPGNNIPAGGIPLDELLEEIARREWEAAAEGYVLGVRQAREDYMRAGGGRNQEGYVNAILSRVTNFFRCLPGYVTSIVSRIRPVEPISEPTYQDAVYQATTETIAAARDERNPAARDAARSRIETGVTITLLRKVIRELMENYDAIQDKLNQGAREKIIREIFKRILYMLNYMNLHQATIADMIIALRTAPRFNTGSMLSPLSTSSQNVYDSTNIPVTVLTDSVIERMNALVSQYPAIAAEYLLVANPTASKLPTVVPGSDVAGKIAEIERSESAPSIPERCSREEYAGRITSVSSAMRVPTSSAATAAANRNMGSAFSGVATKTPREMVMDAFSTVAGMASEAMLAPVRRRFMPPGNSPMSTGRYIPIDSAAADLPNGTAMRVRAPKRRRNGNSNEEEGRGSAIARLNENANIAGPVAPNGNAVAPNGNAVATIGNIATEGGARRRRSHKKTHRKRRATKKSRTSRRR